MPNELERELAQLQTLHDRGDPASLHYADRLQKEYHVIQLNGLSEDVYHAAKSEGHPPQGWTRLSEHPELLEKYAAQLEMSKDQLLDRLHPDNSGFRSEIYLPDAALQQAGYKPTLAFKGSSGMVMGSNGKLYDTSAEDFGANNFPQSIGLKTDYYDCAMNLGHDLKRYGVDFESTGHSLAGGMAAAVAAVTDTHATTLNAAGLNPITTARFAQEHPGVIVAKDLNHLVTNYQMQGELLSDGIQNNIHNIDALRRAELGGTLKEACDVLQRVPEAKALFAQKLGAGLPQQAQETVNAFVNKVATGNTDQLLRDLPLAVGEQHVLAAMTRDAQGNLVPRVQVTSLPETTLLATPLLESLAVVSAGARVGERGGEVVAAAGRLEARGLHAAGRGVDGATDAVGAFAQATTRFEGKVAQTGEHVAGATLAHARTIHAEWAAQVDQKLGQASYLGAELDAALLRGAGYLRPELQPVLQAGATHLEQYGLEAQRQGAAAATADRHAGQVDAATIRSATHTVETATGQTANAYGAAQHAVIGGTGHYARAGLDATAQGVEGTTRHAPAAFATAGATAGLSLAAALELNPANYPRLAEAAAALSQGKHAGSEALERHLEAATVTPSLAANVQSLERQANQHLQLTPAHAPAAQHPAEPSPASDPTRHQQRALHGESSPVDRAHEVQRQQETQSHTAARDAHAPPAVTSAPVMRAPERETATARHAPNAGQPAGPAHVPASHATLQTVAPVPKLSPPLDPPALKDFRHPGHPLNARYEMFRDALGEQNFHQARPTLNDAPEVRGYTAEQKDRLAAGFTARLGTDIRFNTEIQHFRKDGDTLLAVEHPQELGSRPLLLAIPEKEALTRSPEQHTAAWRARELPQQQAVNTQRPDPHSLSPDHPGHPDHPRHAMFEHAREALTSEYARWGMQKGTESLDRETVQVMTAARGNQMNDVGTIRLYKATPDSPGISEHPKLAVYSTPEGPRQGLAAHMAIIESQTLQHAQAAAQFQAVDQQVTQQIQVNQQWQAQINAQAQQGPGLGR
jgi:hypothetical protein